jgi:hypothetical protein
LHRLSLSRIMVNGWGKRHALGETQKTLAPPTSL